MSNVINFPNLGIHWGYVPDKFTVLGCDITFYGIMIGVAILIGILLTVWEAKQTEQDINDYLQLSILLIIFGTLGARIYYILFGVKEFQGNYLKMLNPFAGGFAIYGAIIAGVITITFYAKRHRLMSWKILDTFVPTMLIGQILGLIANLFSRQGFGEYTNGKFAMQIPIDSVRALDVTEKMRQHIEKVDGINMIQVSPVFLYEAAWCLIVLIAILVYRRFEVYKGEIFLIYVCGYGAGRFVFESMRVDKLRIPLIHLPISQVVALTSVLLAGMLLYVNFKSRSQVVEAEIETEEVK